MANIRFMRPESTALNVTDRIDALAAALRAAGVCARAGLAAPLLRCDRRHARGHARRVARHGRRHRAGRRAERRRRSSRSASRPSSV